MTPFGEWRGGTPAVGWIWVALLALVAIPFPFAQSPLPERAVPLMWLLVGGFVVRQSRIPNPLMPLRLFKARNVAGANVVIALRDGGVTIQAPPETATALAALLGGLSRQLQSAARS